MICSLDVEVFLNLSMYFSFQHYWLTLQFHKDNLSLSKGLNKSLLIYICLYDIKT